MTILRGRFPNRSFERNIKINNISTVRYRCYYWAGAIACSVCFGSYGGLISRDPISDSIPAENTRLFICVCVYKYKLILTRKRSGLHRISSLLLTRSIRERVKNDSSYIKIDYIKLKFAYSRE